VTVRQHYGADTARRGHEHRSAVLDRPQSRHGQLLLRLARPVIGRVVGLHHQHAGSLVDDVANDSVVGDLEADHITHPRPTEVQHTGAWPRGEVPRDLVQAGDESAELVAERDVLPERDRVTLDVALAGTGLW
jgi:hypothetical protein